MADFLASLWGLTVADVLGVTGVDVEQVDLTTAAETVELYTNRTESASGGMKQRDIRWIKKAVCWQAAWLIEQPDYAGRMNVDTLNQDGQSVGFSPASSPTGREYAITLAPLAARALKNLSWKAQRTLDVKRKAAVGRTLDEQAYDFLTDETPTGWERI